MKFIYKFSNLIAFAIATALFLWIRPGEEFLREVGFQSDLIRMTMLAFAFVPGIVGGAVIRLLVASEDVPSQR
ncbi:hypothetical protein [Pseudomonas sp. Irchel 3E13]|uniref:hypothetical protein n=1 Tax=Pseudomonas sp. Irchel 3E13 TaxID=2008975 RepID=UPI000BA4AFE5|nr:hypothetical protein [Pseudomonas sp. Irchel 3E13]